MSMMAGSNAAGVPKELAVLWPVNLMQFFLVAVVITSFFFLTMAYIVTGPQLRAKTADVLAVGLALYNIPYGFSVASALFGAPVYSSTAPWLLAAGVAVLALSQAYSLAVARAITPGGLRAWLVVPLAFAVGFLLYFILPPMQTSLYPRLMMSYLYAGAAPCIVYSMLKINLHAAGRLGGFTFKFWAGLFAGVMLYAAAEVFIHLYSPAAHGFIHL